MERLHRTVVQLEEAKRFILNGDVPHLALALILLDNAAEVMMRRIVEDILGTAEMYARMGERLAALPVNPKSEAFRRDIEARIVAPRRQEKIRRYFPEKTKFLSEERSRIPPSTARALEHLHTYRNEIQHHDHVRRESIRPVVLILFDICTDLLVKLDPGASVWESNEDYDWLQRYGFDRRPFFGLGVDDLRERIAAQLRQDLPLDTAEIRNAFIAHLGERLDAMDDLISFVAVNSSIGPDRADALKAIQFWKQKDRPARHDAGEFPSFRPEHDLNSLTQWRAAVAGLNPIEDKIEIFDRFATIEDEFEPLESAIEEIASALDAAIELESDLRRGK
jgi:hypothetical protein